MVPSNMPPQQQNVEIVLLHDARAVHDIAVIGLAAYLSDGPPWIVALATPGPRSGKATTPGAYIDGKTGKVVMPPSPQTVVMKQGTWQVVAGGQGRQEYAWNEPMERKRVPAPEDQYSPFIHGGDVLFRPAPQVAALADLGPVALLFSGWAQEVAPALAYYRDNAGAFGDKPGPAESRLLMSLLSGQNRLLAVVALRTFQGAGGLTPEQEREYLTRVGAGEFAAIVAYLMLSGPGPGDRLAAEAANAAQATHDPAKLRSLGLGAFAAVLFGAPPAGIRARHVLDAIFRQLPADPQLGPIYRKMGMVP
jgi:hypothetical protein